MIDFVLGFATCGAIAFLILHFTKGSGPLKTGLGPNLETILEGVRLIMTQQAQDILTALDGVAPKFEAKVAELQASLEAEKTAHAQDLADIQAKVAAITPADPAAA